MVLPADPNGPQPMPVILIFTDKRGVSVWWVFRLDSTPTLAQFQPVADATGC